MTKKQQKRKKQREREVYEKLQRRRMARLQQVKYERELDRDVRANQEKRTPIRRQRKPEEVLKQLEHNMKILKALEEEYDREMAERTKLHNDLESQGHVTAEQKLKAIAKRAVADAKELEKYSPASNCGESEKI